jgi:hypothetical protein
MVRISATRKCAHYGVGRSPKNQKIKSGLEGSTNASERVPVSDTFGDRISTLSTIGTARCGVAACSTGGLEVAHAQRTKGAASAKQRRIVTSYSRAHSSTENCQFQSLTEQKPQRDANLMSVKCTFGAGICADNLSAGSDAPCCRLEVAAIEISIEQVHLYPL